MKMFFALGLAALLWPAGFAHAEGPDDLYLRIYSLIQDGDQLKASGQNDGALAKYNEAQTALRTFQRGYPDWNTKVVNYRLGYLASRIAEFSQTADAAAPPPASPPTNTHAPASTAVASAPAHTPALPAKPAAPDDWHDQLARFQTRVTQLETERNQLQAEKTRLLDDRSGLQADKSLLEAKLKEALSTQPAAVDPAELARMEEQIKSLQSERDLLKLSVEKANAVPVPDPKALEQSQATIAELNRQLTVETARANTLSQEKQALETKLVGLSAAAVDAAAVEKAKKDLADTNQQLAEQKALAGKLESQRATLEARLTESTRETDAATALRAENELLKKQLADRKSTPAPKGRAETLARQLAQAQAQIAALESDKEVLHLEKTALENHAKRISSQQAAASPQLPAPAPAAAPAPDNTARIQLLEKERDDLQQKLQAAYKQLYGRKGQASANRAQDLENQLERLQARLDAFEARQVPLTTEELALLQKPTPKLTQSDTSPRAKSVKDLPPAAVSLVVEARRYFSMGEYDKAAEDYHQVLTHDQQSVPALANLAAIDIQRTHYDEAETNLSRALALNPNDAYALSVLGNLRFRQAKYDDALDVLSRAAKIDPQNAEVQNYLGLTLSEKGLRGPAETALRKAIQLEPRYASAHNNLAVIYLTQQPPAVELARWHYQRALAAGNPPNPELEKMLAASKSAQ